jgi:hypothetical protein
MIDVLTDGGQYVWKQVSITVNEADRTDDLCCAHHPVIGWVKRWIGEWQSVRAYDGRSYSYAYTHSNTYPDANYGSPKKATLIWWIRWWAR